MKPEGSASGETEESEVQDPSNGTKLVIWDLDETFWSGTLSEGEVAVLDVSEERVALLNRRGIVNSICSKNDYEQARAKLEELGLWSSFVFPAIGWSPKGEMVRSIIADMKLRAANVVFVDDNAMNRAEVEFYNKGVQTYDPADWFAIDCTEWGKDDATLSRHAQYQMLEQRADAIVDFKGDNEAFQSNSRQVRPRRT